MLLDCYRNVLLCVATTLRCPTYKNLEIPVEVKSLPSSAVVLVVVTTRLAALDELFLPSVNRYVEE